MSKHTPGPWWQRKGSNLIVGPIEYGEHSIARVHSVKDEPLILAAPEMYEALKGLLAWCERYAPPESHHYELSDAKAALAKAEGRE